MAKQAKVLTENELTRLLKIIDAGRHSARNRLVVMLGVLSGMRCKEIASVRIGDIVNSNNEINDIIYLASKQTKGKEANQVYVGDKLKKEFLKYFSHKPELITQKQKPLIQSQQRVSFSSQSLQNLIKELFKSAGLDNCSSHSFRRTFITNLSEKAVSARVIQKLARHKSLNTTQIYIETREGLLKSAVNLI